MANEHMLARLDRTEKKWFGNLGGPGRKRKLAKFHASTSQPSFPSVARNQPRSTVNSLSTRRIGRRHLALLGALVLVGAAVCAPANAVHAQAKKPKKAAKTTTTQAPATTAAVATIPATTVAAKKELVFAIVLPSSKDDKAFSQSGYTGLENAVKKSGGKVVFQENVAVASAQEAIRNLASQKPTIVISLGGQFADAIAAVAPSFPDIQFMGVNGNKTGPNLSSWSLAEGEVAYLAGIMVAAENPGLKKIARIAGIEIAPLKLGSAGFIDGARSVDPKIEYINTFTGSMDDVAKAKEATLAAANAGAKFIYTGMNNALVGMEQAADEAGIQLINNTTNKCNDPKSGVSYFGAVNSSTTFATQSIASQLASGTYKAGVARSNLEFPDAFGVVLCGGKSKAETAKLLADAEKKLIAGEIKIGLNPK
jgi:basic membrane protein A and related proteins